MLHQATEYFIKTIPLVFALYGHKEHDLEFLIEKCKIYTMELAKVFPRDTPEEKRLFELLRSAYVEARYTDDFVVTNEDIDELTPKVELLRDVVENVCRKRNHPAPQTRTIEITVIQKLDLRHPDKAAKIIFAACFYRTRCGHAAHYCGKHTN